MTKDEALTHDFVDALENFEEVLAKPKDEFIRDSSIKRFELTMDLAWKTLKSALEDKFGVVVNSPKTTFREAFKQGLIEHDARWLDFVDTRNKTVHTYKEELAEEIYAKLPAALELFKKLAGSLH